MAKMSFDPVDAALTLALAVSGFIMVGIASFNLFDVSFGDTAVTLAGNGLSVAYVTSVLAFGGTILTNDNAELSSLADDVKDLDQYYYGAVVGTAALMVGWVVLPDVASFFQSSDLWGLTYVGVTTTAQFALGWML